MVCRIRVRERYLAGPDGLEVWTGTRTLVALRGEIGIFIAAFLTLSAYFLTRAALNSRE
jgi:hypothetical protein